MTMATGVDTALEGKDKHVEIKPDMVGADQHVPEGVGTDQHVPQGVGTDQHVPEGVGTDQHVPEEAAVTCCTATEGEPGQDTEEDSPEDPLNISVMLSTSWIDAELDANLENAIDKNVHENKTEQKPEMKKDADNPVATITLPGVSEKEKSSKEKEEETLIFLPRTKMKINNSVLIKRWEGEEEEPKKAEDPLADLGEDERKDVNDPGWEAFRRLTSDEDKFHAAINSWSHKEVPDPTKNYTHYGFLRRQMNKQRKRPLEAADSPEQPRKKSKLDEPSCTAIIDKKLFQNESAGGTSQDGSNAGRSGLIQQGLSTPVPLRRYAKPHRRNPNSTGMPSDQGSLRQILLKARQELYEIFKCFERNDPSKKSHPDLERELKEMEKTYRVAYAHFSNHYRR